MSRNIAMVGYSLKGYSAVVAE